MKKNLLSVALALAIVAVISGGASLLLLLLPLTYTPRVHGLFLGFSGGLYGWSLFLLGMRFRRAHEESRSHPRALSLTVPSQPDAGAKRLLQKLLDAYRTNHDQAHDQKMPRVPGERSS